MENLDNALAELANKLGIGIDELYGFLSTRGFEEYVTIRTLRCFTIGICMLLVMVLACCFAFSNYKRYRNENFRYSTDRYECLWWARLQLGAALMFLCAAIVQFVNGISWIIAPNGKIIEMFITLLS